MKLEITNIVILSNYKNELIPAIIMEFRENINGHFAMVKIGNESELVAIPVDRNHTYSTGRSADKYEYEIDYVVKSLQAVEMK